MIELSKTRFDGGTKPRARLNQETVDEYAEAYKAGEKLPAVSLFFDGSDYWMADGFHRYFAAKSAGKKSIQEDITPGSKRDAILYSLSANSRHGLKRSNADKRKAVLTLLDDAEWSKWSNEKIAATCAVSPHTVADIKRAHSANAELEISPHSANAESECISHSANAELEPGAVTYTTKHGTTSTMKTSKIGKPPKKTKPKPKLLTEDESAAIIAENHRLQDVAKTLAKDAAEEAKDNESMAKVFEADDKVAAAMQ